MTNVPTSEDFGLPARGNGPATSPARRAAVRECDHEFTPDLEYDPSGETINCEHCGAGVTGPTGKTGLSGLTGPSMKEWMPAEDYAVMEKFMNGEIGIEELRAHARKVLAR